jgi:hypothetical protein
MWDEPPIPRWAMLSAMSTLVNVLPYIPMPAYRSPPCASTH